MLRTMSIGRKASKATRAKMSAAAKRRVARGDWPPAAGKSFTARELRLIRTLPPAEAARQTGRTLKAIYSQRVRMGVAG